MTDAAGGATSGGQMSHAAARFRRWRLHRAELALADAEHDLRKWGFANTPSEDDRAERRIEKLRRRVEARSGSR